MEEKVLAELKQIKQILSELIGSSNLPSKERFSKESISKAAKEYQKLSIERGEWLDSSNISKAIRGAPWDCGHLLIEKFKFTNYFKRGKTLYFNKKDLVELGKELKKRNINLKDYADLLDDQERFKKYLATINTPKGKKKLQRYSIPEELHDILLKPYAPPLEKLVRSEISGLMEEYTKFDLSEYLMLYQNKTYAYFKYDYTFDRYIKPDVKKFCKDWCFKFNYANTALTRILELKKDDPDPVIKEITIEGS